MDQKTHQQTNQKSGNILFNYLKESIQELKKVSWPSKQETWKKSWIVVWFSLGFAVFLGAVDFILNKIIEVIL
ncbi:MAG: preprotein translocase subunit SecE [Candidatus Kerfeldbacteria bacterium RIFOXYA2_FULL_38_24]|uniref:Protein translocase subunit SecE n=1 Tax=Candidatus Kerfeldbacteria bacterium RIFOXYB2_FULL_38_14 TaxID=1798547 RepID=A0A1G2B972_9BACT|nr:MAG: preprotein translocase subunit SecE [Candidatus Kerfeldbacteria bacterium RIFOXYB2_FULL_38_14]OGY86482.1 MAG: preprotein translocase subunit SecE [Candidatus Kerfeldbacteria bacterium RIFOXYA2_FULL_38_24]OGY90471.1 MAG: preprotein translocase subunit SecE [Candidatus Kerfeldbacteria bacterium RIFOXYC2_FULL_38_9]